MSQSYGIHWFRRDLRVAGNIPLKKQFEAFEGRVLTVFCFDKAFLSRPDFSVNRFQFFLERIKNLKEELQQLGCDLLVLDVGPEAGFKQLFEQLEKSGQPLPKCISWGRDYEPFARARDEKMHNYFTENGIDVLVEKDHLLIEPEELCKSDGTGYQVYTPFSKKWNQCLKSSEFSERLQEQKSGIAYLKRFVENKIKPIFKMNWKDWLLSKSEIKDVLDHYIQENQKKVTVTIPSSSTRDAVKAVLHFKQKIKRYKLDRDIPSLKGTSGLSIFLKNGTLTVPMLIQWLGLKPYINKTSGPEVFLSEFIWREFYYHILYRHPEVESEAFLKRYKSLSFPNNKSLFLAWKDGQTGFPLVDAGMRQLKTTGWMHNRVRMVVASFLIKDLLVDWRWGEKYFMETLLDGDIAPNNGGWQWAASTGCDAQPYFRIFNPWRQSEKFDPQGLYIKKYVPELKNLSAKELHKPILNHPIYPKPIVDHDVQKKKALALFKP